MTLPGRRVATLLVLSLFVLCGLGSAEAGVNAFWKPLGGSASGGGISSLGANVSAESARVAFGSDNLPVVVYGTESVGVTGNAQIAVRRWTGTAWHDISPAPAVSGAEPRIAIAANGTRYLSWLQDDGNGPQVHLLQRGASGTSWTSLGVNSSAVTTLTNTVFSHALAVGTDNVPVVAIDTLAQTNRFPLDEGVLQGTHQIYVLTFNGTVWQYLGSDPSGGGASNASSLIVDGANYATHQAFNPSLTVVNGRPTVAFVYSTSYASGNVSAPIEFIPGNTEIFVTQLNANGSTWTAVGPDVPQSDDGGPARGGLGGASRLDGDSATPSIASRDGASPLIWLTWDESGTAPGIYARVFNSTSGLWVPGAGPSSDLLSDPPLVGFEPQVVVGPDGGAVVTWSSFDGATAQIFVKRSGPAGFEEMGPDSAFGPGVSDAPFFALRPSVGAPAAGGPAVAWLTNPNGDDGYQVYLRQFSTATAFLLTVNRTGAGLNQSSVTSTAFGFDCPSDSCSELFPNGQTVALTPVAGPHALFTAWTGCTSVTGTTCNVLMNANKTVTANFVAANTVTVSRLGNGAASVSSTPAGINCGIGTATDCSERYAAGTSVTLNASVPVGTIFNGWGGDCAFRGTNLSCPLGVITGDRNVMVTSTLKQYPLSLRAVTKAGPTASGTIDGITPDLDCTVGQPTCTQLVDHGTLVSIQGVAGTGSRFIDYVTVPATGLCSNLLNASCKFTMTGNAAVTAEFRTITALSVAKSGTGASRTGNIVTFAGDGFTGSGINCGTDCIGEAFSNTSVVFTATVATGSDLTTGPGSACSWTASGTTRSCSFIADGLNQSVNAVFTQQKRRLHVNGLISGLVLGNTSAFTTSNPPGIDCGNETGAHGQCDFDFDHGTTVALTPFEDPNTLFNHWTGCSRLNQSVCLVDMTANTTATRFFDAARTLDVDSILDVIALNRGSGTLTTSLTGANSSCTDTGSGCSVTRKVPTGATGTLVTVTPKANVGSTFRWASSDFNCAVGTGNPCTATMSNNHSAIGTFTLNRHRVDILRRLNGSVVSASPLPDAIDCGTLTTGCTATLNFGTQVHLLATPDDGFTFDKWQGVTCAGGQTTASCAFKISGNLSVVPFFRVHTFVNVTKAGNGQGTVTASIAPGGLLKPTTPTCGESCTSLNFEAFEGRRVTLVAREKIGSRFDGFAGDCTSSNSSVSCNFIPQGNNDSVVATFTLRQFGITVGNNGNGSVVDVNALVDPVDCGGGPLGGHTDCTSTLDFGTPVDLQATPLDGFIFAGWTTSPTALCTNRGGNSNSSCSFKVPNGNVSLAPSYRRATRLTVSRGGNGTVTSTPAGINCGTDCSETFFDGRQVTLTAVAAAGSTFAGFSGCTSNTSSCAFIPSGHNQTVVTTFNKQAVNLRLAVQGDGFVTRGPDSCDSSDAVCNFPGLFGDSVTLVAQPNAGNRLISFTGCTTSNASACTILLNGSKNVSATFSFFIAVSKLGDGTGTITSSPAGTACGAGCSTYAPNTVVTLTEAPAAGSTFGGWDDDCAFRGFNTSCALTLNQNHVVSGGFFRPLTLTVISTGAGTGTVTSSPAGINCGLDCTEKYVFGTLVTLSATPTGGSIFAGFTGCDSILNGSCRVSIDGNRTVSAAFDPPIVGLAVSIDGGNGSVTGPGIACATRNSGGCFETFNAGTEATLTATADPGFFLNGWDSLGSGGIRGVRVLDRPAVSLRAAAAARADGPRSKTGI